ncbi:MAG: hypothetical protein V4585_03190 [Bacteroidota bacterium]
MKKEEFDLENLPRENIFKVPDNYFDELPMRVQTRTSAKAKVVPLVSWSKQRTWASIAACSTIMILGYFTLMPKQESLGNEALSGVKNQEIVNYLIQENLTQNDVAEQFNNNKGLKINDSDFLDNLKVSDKDILQSVDLKDIEEEI